MKLTKWMFLGVVVCAVSVQAQADEHVGSLGLNYTLGPSFIAGGSHATDVSSVEPGVGAGLQYTLMPQLDLKMDYDYIDADLRTQALTFGGQWRLPIGHTWEPFVGGGIGFGKPHSGEGWDHFSLKLSAGLERALTSNVSVVPVISYQYVEGPDPFGSVHVIEPGIRMVYYFDYAIAGRPTHK